MEFIIISLVKAALVAFVLLTLAAYLVWIERKVLAHIQLRVGPYRVGPHGLLQPLSDLIKLVTKEGVIPSQVNKFYYLLAPFLAVALALVSISVVPFGTQIEIFGIKTYMELANVNIGILVILAISSVSVYGVALGGWASNNRWSLLGGIRGSAQMISYEIALALAIVAVVLTYGTLDLQEMARAQGHLLFGFIPAWGILYQPVAFIVLLVAGIAESKRIPFDLPESESELISGYFTEYSGMKHLMFFMTDFVEVIIVAGLATTLFFGGWQVPFLGREGFVFPGGAELALPNIVIVVLQLLSFLIKVVFFCWFQIMVRWTLPRFRYDQLMRLGWLGLLPIALANVMLTAIVILTFGNF
jgi:NADH-quinone oxidoreductase subunit H